MRATSSIFMSVALSWTLACPALARDDKLASTALDELSVCQAVVGDSSRLACFDRASRRILAARDAGDLLALDRTKVVENKRRAFGLMGQSDLPLGGGSVDREITVKKLETTIAAVTRSTAGRYRLRLADGTIWETVEPLMLEPRRGAAIVLNRATLGGYRASVAGGRSVLVKRIS